MATTRQRNYGIDALKNLAMFMIVVYHIMLHGGILHNLPQFSGRYEIAWFIEILAFCAVNCYALASGFVGIDTKYKYTNFILIWLRVFLYGIIILAILSIMYPSKITLWDFRYAIFPISINEYWYVTAYAGLFIAMPILNLALEKLNRRILRNSLILTIIYSSIIPMITQHEVFGFNFGYSVWWLIVLYLVGGYIKKYGFLPKAKPRIFLLGYFGVALLALVLKNVFEPSTGASAGIINQYIAITTVAMGVFLLLYFSRITVGPRLARIVSFFAPLSFSVYLIHDNEFVRRLIVADAFRELAGWRAPLMLIAIFAISAAIYLGCAIIDLMREQLFRHFKIKERLVALEMRLRSKE